MSRTLSILALLLLAAPSIARADVPLDYPDDCTLANVENGGGRGCVECEAWHGDPQACITAHRGTLHQACQGQGASTWTEIWCENEARPVPTALPSIEALDEPHSDFPIGMGELLVIACICGVMIVPLGGVAIALLVMRKRKKR